MVDVQMGWRKQPEVIAPLRLRRKRPNTLRSIRELLLDDHYAILAAGKY